jgi:zinc D-Ala-D-Ala carboxypeptidase
MKKIYFVIVLVAIVIAGWFVWHKQQAPTQHIATSGNHSTQQSQASGFNKKEYSLDDPASMWVIVNKRRLLQPKTYAPNDLVVPNVPLRLSATNDEMKMRRVAASALEQMFATAKKENIQLMVSSGYRSYNFQVNLYNRYVSQQGRAVADTQSARPGHSEHQTGLAVDVEPVSRKCEVDPCFADTPEGTWVAQNAYKYGFVVRYATGNQGITGYIPEPWHVRYVGEALAQEVHKQGNPPLETFFGLPPAPDYQ